MRAIILIVIAFWVYGCSGNSSPKKIAGESLLPDSLFPLKDIQNSFIMDKFWCDENGTCCTDSVSKKVLIHLDSAQKLKLIQPIIISEHLDEDGFNVQEMDAMFVAKQKKIGELMPIVVYIRGEDYESMFYILLDQSGKPISHFLLSGGLDAAPYEGPDETLQLPPIRHSFIHDNEIKTYTLTEFMIPDSIQHPSVFDSINYVSKILPNGKIETIQLDSIQFERMGTWYD